MTDIRIKELTTVEGPFFDWILRETTKLLDEREELASAVRVALGTDSLSDQNEILPDLNSVDRRGWWGDFEAEEIWGGWPIGCKNWLLTRAKITDAPSIEGSTLQRAKKYTQQALQPLIDKKIATRIDVTATRTELNRIEVGVIIYRGPKVEIDLRYQLLWEEEVQIEDAPVTTINTNIRIPYRDLILSGSVISYGAVPDSGNLILSSIAPIRGVSGFDSFMPPGNLIFTRFSPVIIKSSMRNTLQGNLVFSPTPPVRSVSGSTNYGVGTHNITIPAYNNLTVKIWGPGGGGGGVYGTIPINTYSGGTGVQSSFASSTQLIANGGTGGWNGNDPPLPGVHGGIGSNGSSGTASGGDVNTNGGGNAGGAGGNSGGGDPGIGGTGGAGGYVQKTWAFGSLGAPVVGNNYNLVIGVGGSAGSGDIVNGVAGSNGSGQVSWN